MDMAFFSCFQTTCDNNYDNNSCWTDTDQLLENNDLLSGWAVVIISTE